ncbi:MAG: ATP-binding protein [Flavobacteriales bacterium]|nr:ATP-binding protein [Flavobacteriales bacterium]
MVPVELGQLTLFKKLQCRSVDGEKEATVLLGLATSLFGDAAELLGFVRKNYPSFTSHDIQHSLRILRKIECILTDEAKEHLTSVEIFGLLVSAGFHDVGMIQSTGDLDLLRRNHHVESDKFIQEFLVERCASISEYIPRLSACIGFVARAHGLTWDELNSSRLFTQTERVFDQEFRIGLLAILLRVGDLMDLDSERSCDPVKRFMENSFPNEESNAHHHRHKGVRHFNYDSTQIQIEVEASSIEEHTIWTEWFGYLKQDIIHANTYVLTGNLKIFALPKPEFDIKRAEGANYELWQLRFEIDEKGRIWDVISKSVYTGKYDFIRELIQNSIDACLRWIYESNGSNLDTVNPKHWKLEGYSPCTVVCLRGNGAELSVTDNGIGMEVADLKKFLFNVASTGYGEIQNFQKIKFPSIAKFGIGFVACLTKANTVIIETRSRKESSEIGREVVLRTESLNTFCAQASVDFGTKVTTKLKTNLDFGRLVNYVGSTFYSPSVPLVFFDYDGLANIFERAGMVDRLEKELAHCSSASDYEELFKMASHVRGDMDTHGLPFVSDLTLTIPSKRGLESLAIDKPLFLKLDENFQVEQVSTKYESSNSSNVSLLYIPIEINMPEIGIEWYSVHGFIIHDYLYKKDIITQTFEGQSGLAESVIASSDEWVENGIELIGDYLDDDVTETVHDKVEQMMKALRGENRDSLFHDRSLLFENSKLVEGETNFMVADLVSNTVERYDMMHYFVEDMDGSYSEFLDDIGYLSNFLSSEERHNGVYQDGIRLPIRCSNIAPIGTCSGIANFFGDARFELNVTRKSIDEADSALRIWTSEIGTKIQRNILNKVVSVFEDNRIAFELHQLPSTRKDNRDSVYDYSERVLISLIKNRSFLSGKQ